MIELKRLWHNKKICIALAIFAALCFYHVRVGIVNYKAYIEESFHFQNCEKLIASYHENYTQYAATGFRLLWKWSPLNIFFNSKGIKKTYATINSTEIIEIIDSRRCEYKSNSRFFNSFSDILNMVGGLLYLYLGFTAICNIEYIKFLRRRRLVLATIFRRAGFLILFVIIIFLVSFLMARISGIFFSWGELEIYWAYMLYTTLFLLAFYGIGVILAFLLWSKKIVALALIILFIVVVFVPDLLEKKRISSVETLNIKKVSILSKLEKEAGEFFEKNPNLTDEEKRKNFKRFYDKYMNYGFRKNEKLEKGTLEELINDKRKEESRSIFSPSLYLYYLADELSANSSADYTRYFNEVLTLRFRFISYINDKRLKGEKVVHPLDLDYFYMQKPILPESFKTSLFILLGYLLLVMCFTYLFSGKFLKKDGEKSKFPAWALSLKPGKLNYKKFEDSATLKETYAALTNGDASGLDENCIFLKQFLNVPVHAACKHLSRLKKIDEKKITHLLALFDITMDTPLLEQNVFEFHVAFVLSQDSKLLVIWDFLSKMSYSFYEKFEEALKYILESGKTLLFLSLKSFKLKTEDKYIDNEESQSLDLKYHSLR
jgi:hypothetical protein